MTHTPGPWEVEAGTTTGLHRMVYASEDASERPDQISGGMVIAQVMDSNWRWNDSEQLEANARLIASAPELLEALETAERHCRWMREDWDGEDATLIRACALDLGDVLRAAINKALGNA